MKVQKPLVGWHSLRHAIGYKFQTRATPPLPHASGPVRGSNSGRALQGQNMYLRKTHEINLQSVRNVLF